MLGQQVSDSTVLGKQGCMISPKDSKRGWVTQEHHHSFIYSKLAHPCLLYLYPFICSNKNSSLSILLFCSLTHLPNSNPSANPANSTSMLYPHLSICVLLWFHPCLRPYHILPEQQQNPSNPSPHFHTCPFYNPLSKSNQSNFSKM